MGRLRATLSGSVLDSRIQGCVSAAGKAIQSALQECRKTRVKQNYTMSTSRLLHVERDLARVLAALGNVGFTEARDHAEEIALEKWREEQRQTHKKKTSKQADPTESELLEELIEEEEAHEEFYDDTQGESEEPFEEGV